MIFQSLATYYDRKRRLELHSVPPVGFEENAISFVVVLDPDGSFVNLEDWREGEGRRTHGKALFVPQGKDRPGTDSWKTAFLLWDHPRYVFGLPKDGDDKGIPAKRLEVFQQRILESFPDSTVDKGVNAVVLFYKRPEGLKQLRESVLWPQIEQTNGNISFRLRDSVELICQSPFVQDTVVREFEEDLGLGVGQCLITGLHEAIAELHPATPVQGSQATAKIHSFNLSAFNSYGKVKGANAPVSKRATFAYTTALNYLLGTRNKPTGKQCIRIADTSTVFWADKPNALEDNFADIFDESPKDDPDRNARALKALVEAPQQGIAPVKDEQTRFFVLGLGPNAARIAIRFWHVGTVAHMAHNIQRHFDDLEIVRAPFEKPYLSVYRLLLATAPATAKYPHGDPEKVSPNLGGEVMRAILSGQPYPATLLQGAIRRIRAERDVTYSRAANLKACLNRQARFAQTSEKELTVSLDHSNINPGYRLGRLFAVLEKIQKEASPHLNATIRERFYGAASSTPVTVFSNLMKLKNHHLAKLENPGRRVNLERLIGEIVEGVSDFPPHLSLADQGRFAIGYYHQRQAFFSKSTETEQGE